MNISKQYAWQSAGNGHENNPSFLRVCEDWLLERVDVEKLQ